MYRVLVYICVVSPSLSGRDHHTHTARMRIDTPPRESEHKTLREAVPGTSTAEEGIKDAPPVCFSSSSVRIVVHRTE